MAQESAGHQPSHAVNQILGLLVFAGGVVLLVLVFVWAYHLYLSLDATLVHVSPLVAQPPMAGAPPGAPLPPGTVTAAPGAATNIWQIVGLLVGKFVMLLAMGWIGALIASKGVALAVGAARPRAAE